jgi:hypothetical protein
MDLAAKRRESLPMLFVVRRVAARKRESPKAKNNQDM